MNAYDTSRFARPGDAAHVLGGTARVAFVSMSVDPMSEEPPRTERHEFTGAWDKGILRGNHDPGDGITRIVRIGAREVVQLSHGWEPDGKGNATRFTVSGRCLARDADMMAASVAEACRAHVEAMLAGYARLADAMQATEDAT